MSKTKRETLTGAQLREAIKAGHEIGYQERPYDRNDGLVHERGTATWVVEAFDIDVDFFKDADPVEGADDHCRWRACT